jgi:hypothetical protein
MRILAMLISRCLDHFVAMIEDLLAKIRAGTIVLPDWAYDPPAEQAGYCTERRRAAAPRSRTHAANHMRTSGVAGADDPSDAPSDGPEQSADLAPCRLQFTRPPACVPRRLPEPAPRGLAGYPSVVPRRSAENSHPGAGRSAMPISLRYRNICAAAPVTPVRFSKYSRTPGPCPSAVWKCSSTTRPAADIDRAG